MKQGFLQAIGIVLYCTLVATFMWNIEKVMVGKPPFFAPIAFLTLLCTSALTCALIVFYKPYKLFFEGKKKEAVDAVVSTAGFLFVFVVILLTALFLNK